MNKFSWSVWLKGLAAVAIGGAATGATQATTNGASLKGTGLTAAAGSLVTVLGYFLQSPLFKPNTPAPPADAPKA